MLPFEPESVAKMRERYPAALAEVFDTESIALGSVERPGDSRRYVFDFADGMRLIVSRDRLPSGRILLHFSASMAAWPPETGWREKGLAHFLCQAVHHWRLLSGDARPLRLAGLSEGKGVPHWFVEEERT